MSSCLFQISRFTFVAVDFILRKSEANTKITGFHLIESITYQYKYTTLIYVPLTRLEIGRHHAIGYLASSWNCVEFEQFYFHETGSAFLLRHANALTYDV